jgi:hypothetical protein
VCVRACVRALLAITCLYASVAEVKTAGVARWIFLVICCDPAAAAAASFCQIR